MAEVKANSAAELPLAGVVFSRANACSASEFDQIREFMTESTDVIWFKPIDASPTFEIERLPIRPEETDV